MGTQQLTTGGEEPVYKHRLLIQPQYIEANSRRIREKLQE